MFQETVTEDSCKRQLQKMFSSKSKYNLITNVLIDGRNFFDQPIIDQIKNYDEIRKIGTGQRDDYTTGC